MLSIVVLSFLLSASAAAQTVCIDSPSTPGEIWPSGLPAEIKWHIIGTPDAVKIMVSYDAMASWNLLVDCYPDVGVWTWDIPAFTESERCYLRIYSKYQSHCYVDHVFATTGFSFIITQPPLVTVHPIDITEAASGDCFDVTIDVENQGGYELALWFDVDMFDNTFEIVGDPEHDLPFTLPPFGTVTVTRPFCIPYGHYAGNWNVKAMLWGIRDGDRFAGPRLYDSGWMHPMTVGIEAASWSAVKAERDDRR